MPRIRKIGDFRNLLKYKDIEYVDDYGQQKIKKRYNWQDNKDLVEWLLIKKRESGVNINQSYVNSKIEDVILWQPNAKRIIKDYIATLKTFIKRDLERQK